MPMRLKDYGRNHKKRKEYIHQSGILLAGVDVSKAKHDACIGTLEGVSSRIGFANARDGFKRFEEAIKKNMFGKQLVKPAGLDVRLYESGSSILKSSSSFPSGSSSGWVKMSNFTSPLLNRNLGPQVYNAYICRLRLSSMSICQIYFCVLKTIIIKVIIANKGMNGSAFSTNTVPNIIIRVFNIIIRSLTSVGPIPRKVILNSFVAANDR